jgi:hypothetical protein
MLVIEMVGFFETYPTNFHEVGDVLSVLQLHELDVHESIILSIELKLKL